MKNSITKLFICYNLRYMSYGHLSNYSLCSQPPTSCSHEIHETIKLQTGKRITIFYCTKQEEQTPTKQKGTYVGLQRIAESVPTEPVTACSLSGKK